MTMACPDDAQLSGFFEGELAEVASRQIDAHLESCIQCLSRLQRLEGELTSRWKRGERFQFIPLDPLAAELASQLRELPRQQRGVSLPAASEAAWPSPPAELQPAAVYRGLTPHARGGLGEVFISEDVSLRRRVALKLLQNRWLRDRRAKSDFLQEVEIASRLEHPGIVPIHGVGETSDGRPWYSMRFVEGETLRHAIARHYRETARSAQERNLSFRALIRHLVTACNTIAFAHSRHIIHRDLKPENIMLGPFAETLVLDWGMAKCLPGEPLAAAAAPLAEIPAEIDPALPRSGHSTKTEAGESSRPEATRAGDLLGTPSYMSPEQARGELESIGTATDIFGLGATLYVILTGVPPFQEQSVERLLDRARRGDVVPPRMRSSHVPSALDAICRKAMAAEPGQRYASALELAQDLENWLADEPVGAWPDPWTDRLRRFLRRRKTAVAVLVVLLIVLPSTLTIGSMIVAEERAKREVARRTAAHKEQTAQQISEYLQRIFQSADPLAWDEVGFQGPGVRTPDATLKRMLDNGTRLLRDQLQDQPLVRAGLLNAIGNSYRALGQWATAREVLEEAYEIRKREQGISPLTLDSLYSLARLADDEGRYAEAEGLYREVVAGREKLLPPPLLQIATAKYHLGWMLFNQPLSSAMPQFDPQKVDAAARLLHEAHDIRCSQLPSQHRDIGYSLAALAAVKSCQPGQETTARLYAAQALEIFRHSDQESMLGSVLVEYLTAERYRNTNRLAEADAIYERILALMHEHLGQDHPLVIMHMGNMLGLYRKQGNRVKGEPLAREALKRLRKQPAMRSLPVCVDGLMQMGDYLREQNTTEAAEIYREAIQYARERPRENQQILEALRHRLAAVTPLVDDAP